MEDGVNVGGSDGGDGGSGEPGNSPASGFGLNVGEIAFTSWSLSPGKVGLGQYVVLAHWMLCCPVGYVERGGPYLP